MYKLLGRWLVEHCGKLTGYIGGNIFWKGIKTVICFSVILIKLYEMLYV